MESAVMPHSQSILDSYLLKMENMHYMKIYAWLSTRLRYILGFRR